MSTACPLPREIRFGVNFELVLQDFGAVLFGDGANTFFPDDVADKSLESICNVSARSIFEAAFAKWQDGPELERMIDSDEVDQ